MVESVGGGAADGLLPQVSGAAGPEGPTCTYYTEQRSACSFDLFATTFPRSRAQASKATPRERRMPVINLHEQAKCTVLPALSSIDRLLSPAAPEKTCEGDGGVCGQPAAPQDPDEAREAAEADDLCLPLLEEHRKSLAELEEGLTRLYPGRCVSISLGSTNTPVPSDDEFRGWLTMPRGGYTSRQATSGSLSRFTNTERLMGSNYPSTSSLSLNSVSEFEGGESKPRVWLILLMRSTYENPSVTLQNVAICLAEQLGMSMQEAEQRARDAQVRLLAVAHRCEDRREAFARLRALRKRGLAVQVCSEAGAPCSGEDGREDADKTPRGSAGPSGTQRRAAARDYGELFRRSLRGTDTLLPRLPPSARSTPRRRPGRRWKGEGGEVDIQVLPDDPVAALFQAEHDQQAAEDANSFRPHRGKQSIAEGTAGKFNNLMWKHRSTIRKTAEMSKEQKAQQRPGSQEQDPGLPSAPSSSAPEGSEVGKEPSERGAAGGGGLWEAVLDAVVPKQKIPPARREACQMMRFFVFGRIGNEDARTMRESEKVFYEALGTKEQVHALFKMWQRLDQDGSGRVDILEFQTFAKYNMREKMEALLHDSPPTLDGKQSVRSPAGQPAWCRINSVEEIPDVVFRLCNKLANVLLGKKSSFILEDMMRLMWPCAQQRDLKVMHNWCREFLHSTDMRRAQTPPLLPQADFEGLCSVFEYFDEGRRGTLRFEDLVSKGLIYEEQAPAYLKQWDRNGDGILDLLEFCEMMCPVGFRAHPDAATGSLSDGTRVVHDHQLDIWRVDDREDEVLASLVL